MIKKILIVSIIAALLILSGCAENKENSKDVKTENKTNPGNKEVINPPKEDIEVKVPTLTSGSPIIIADELGFFKEEGIKIKYVGSIPSGNQIQSVITGDIDFTVGNHADRIIEARSKGIKVKIILAQSETTKDMPHMTWFVPINSSIKTAQDLKGKKIASVYITGGCPITNLREYLKKNGMELKDVNTVLMPDEMQEAALSQGLIDVASIHAPKSGLLINTGKARVLFSDFDTFGTLGGNNYATSEKQIKENPEKVKRFSNAIVKAQKWTNENHDEADKIFARVLDIKPELTKYFTRIHYSSTGIERDERIQIWIDALVTEGEIKEGQIKASDIYTNEFNPNYKP